MGLVDEEAPHVHLRLRLNPSHQHSGCICQQINDVTACLDQESPVVLGRSTECPGRAHLMAPEHNTIIAEIIADDTEGHVDGAHAIAVDTDTDALDLATTFPQCDPSLISGVPDADDVMGLHQQHVTVRVRKH